MSDADLMNIFWVEVGDYLTTLSNAVLQIETGMAADRTALLREMNRVAHSMKGAARAVGVGVIETIGHYLEDLFEAAYNDQLELTPDVCDLIYDGLDVMQNVVNGIDNSAESLALVLARLEQRIAMLGNTSPPAPLSANGQGETSPPSPLSIDGEGEENPLTPSPLHGEGGKRDSVSQNDQQGEKKGKRGAAKKITATLEVDTSGTLQLRPAEESVRVPVSKLDRLMGEVSELLIARLHSEERGRDLLRLQRLNHRWRREWRTVRTAYIRLARRLQTDGADDEVMALFRFLETNQRYLNEANRQLAQLNQAMAGFNAQLGMLAEQLQEDIGGMRLVPFESVIGSFQRIVRDMARDTDKRIHFDVTGAHVEIDKTALDALKDPILHLLRNAVDHGIETPDEREQAGKPPRGRIDLLVEQRGKEIHIRVRDDGRGLDAFRIGRAAVQAGLLSSAEAANLSDDDAYNLIFHPGLSTSDEVTALSGRGMGMDIARTRVESLRGRISVQSQPGKGTTFSLRIPLSLSRLSCILLRVGGQDFAVPSVAVARMLKVRRDGVFTAEGREMALIGEQPTPLIALGNLLDISPTTSADAPELTLMVLSVGERAVAFEVDALFSEQELVLKPLGREIAGTPYVSGAALLGTGDVLIVLDANDLIRGALGGVRLRPAIKTVEPAVQDAEQRIRILIADDSITTRTLEKHILETAGFDVRVAVDGAEAWEMLSESVFDVLIADVEMPNMDGLALTRQVRATETIKHLPVILLTSLSKPEQREAGLKAGADAYLVKSKFDQAELLRVIKALV